MEQDLIDNIREYAFLLKGLSVVNDIYHAAKDGENVTNEEDEAAQFFLTDIQRMLAFKLNDMTEMLK